MPKTYLFYDIETSGLNKAFDQVLQFAAIRTDEAFNELERHQFFVKLNPDVIPTPQALITNRISIKQLQAQGIPEFEAIKKIHQLLNTPGTISLGYNTLGFDDEFLRFSFHKNLLPPYTHQYANFCGRADLYPVTVMYYLFKPEILNWPQVDEKISLKLEQLNAANNFAQGTAHNAIVDVEITLALAKKLQKETETWNYALDYFNKNKDEDRIKKLPTTLTISDKKYHTGLLINGSHGIESNFQSYTLALGQHNHYKNQTIWLRLDRPELSNSQLDNFNETTWVINKKLAEPPLLLPNIERFNKYMKQEQREIVAHNIAWLQTNAELLTQIANHYRDFTFPKIPQLDIDAALYQNGFLPPYEQQLCQQFHQVGWQEKVKLLNQLTETSFYQQAVRIIGRYDKDNLLGAHKDEFITYLASLNPNDETQAMVDHRNKPRTTPTKALTEITALRETSNLDQEQLEILDGLEDYLKALTNK